MFQNKLLTVLFFFFLFLIGYSVFSYSLTDPNLVLSSWQPYWQFQTWMWQTIFNNNRLLTGLYAVLVTGLFGVYSWLVLDKKLTTQLSFVPSIKTILIYFVIVSPLLFSYNALSHDVFNYIFNAKMVLVYGVNPHDQVALDFATDDWTRFMHNTHTPAPYGYGWTIISLVPYILGIGKFVVTWLSFRLFAVLSILLLYFSLQFLAQRITGKKLETYQLAVLFLNPLLIIEVISNGHNDLWMLFPAVCALGIALFVFADKRKQVLKWLSAVGLLLVSVSIKYATVVLVPVLLLLVFTRRFVDYVVTEKIPIMGRIPTVAQAAGTWVEKFWVKYIPLICSVALFLPLLIPRSQLFHSWYLLWPLVWLPLIEQQWWRKLLILFSFTSLLRYIPWLYAGGFETYTVLYQQLITWSALLLFLMFHSKKSSRLGLKH